MNRLSKHVLFAVLAFFCGVAAVAYRLSWYEPEKEPDIVSISRFDSIFSKDLNLVTGLAEMPELREVSLRGDDVEIRIWRAYSVSTVEGVFFKRVSGQWSGLHIGVKTDQHGEVRAAEVEQLETPAEGWSLFWGRMAEKGILLLPLTPENECDTRGLDGIRYVVEINQNNTYRNYQYREGDFECRESRQMTEIGEIIGLEFDSGQQECKTYEWFPCMTNRKARSLTSP